MKPTLVLALSFLLLAFFTDLPLAFPDDAKLVDDVNGDHLSPGLPYYIVPAIYGSSGGLTLGQTGNSKCPLTVLQDYRGFFDGRPVRFTISGTSPIMIFIGTKLEIEFAEKPSCTESSKWLVFADDEIVEACVGIGGAEGHPGQRSYDGNFHIEKYKFGYKLVFCVTDTPVCMDVGRFDAGKGEGGRRLILTEHEAFDLAFVPAFEPDKVIKSVV